MKINIRERQCHEWLIRSDESTETSVSSCEIELGKNDLMFLRTIIDVGDGGLSGVEADQLKDIAIKWLDTKFTTFLGIFEELGFKVSKLIVN